MKYHLITYGCQMNTADSEEMSQPLASRGFTATGSIKDADIVLMNTCTVRDQAEHRADSNIGRLRVWKEKNPDRILIVAGCAASRWGDSIKQKYPFIDLVSPATQIEQFPEAIAQVLKERWDWDTENKTAFEQKNDVQVSERRLDVGTPFLFGNDDTAYVTIMRGCNYSCSYCIVPQVRGREVYRPMPQILEEIQIKARQGFKEVMLLGQTVNSYHWRDPAIEQSSDQVTPEDTGSHDRTITRSLGFADLLREVNAIDGIERIRFMSPHPRHMRDAVIDAMRDSAKVARHIHLPVQSGSNRMLTLMKRLYTRNEYLTIVEKLRAAIPGILITTDIIVGAPGETAGDFQDTLSLLHEIRFNGLFAFKYSPRPGTAAAEQADDVPSDVKEERLQEILSLNDQINSPEPAGAH